MWTRKELKADAKHILKKNYFYVLGFYLIYLLLSGNFLNLITQDEGFKINFNLGTTYSLPLTIPVFLINYFFIIGIILIIFRILYDIFIASPLEIGYHRFYLINRNIPPKFTTLFFAFTKTEYLNIVKICFLKDLKIFLWSLLLFVPGIIKSYEYQMIPFLLAENPNLESNRAFELTYEMTHGEKFNLFILDLSFIGWYILGDLLIIGRVFVDVYVMATYCELYNFLKDHLIDEGITTYDELPAILTDL